MQMQILYADIQVNFGLQLRFQVTAEKARTTNRYVGQKVVEYARFRGSGSKYWIVLYSRCD